ncbi:hypothetical protein C0058_16040 [Pseudomonas sp. NC02]|nr:hypothetical protein C0058_16040 [Pseudomonas sp. NC02]
MGAGLLAKAVLQSPDVSTDPPPSRASPLPHWFCEIPVTAGSFSILWQSPSAESRWCPRKSG